MRWFFTTIIHALLPSHLPFLQVLWKELLLGRFLYHKQMELWLQNANGADQFCFALHFYKGTIMDTQKDGNLKRPKSYVDAINCLILELGEFKNKEKMTL